MMGIGYRDDCRDAFVDLKILTLPSAYILENLLYLKRNEGLFGTHGDVHDYSTRQRDNLVPAYLRLVRCQDGPGYWAIKLFNVLPTDIKNCLSRLLIKGYVIYSPVTPSTPWRSS